MRPGEICDGASVSHRAFADLLALFPLQKHNITRWTFPLARGPCNHPRRVAPLFQVLYGSYAACEMSLVTENVGQSETSGHRPY